MSSSLYGVLFDSAGGTQTATFLLKLLDKTPSDFGRYRDAYVTDEYIVIHTRCGGGNRSDYRHVFATMREHPLYSHDDDCEYDETYADIYFRHPSGYEDLLREMAASTVTPSEKWAALFKALGV